MLHGIVDCFYSCKGLEMVIFLTAGLQLEVITCRRSLVYAILSYPLHTNELLL